MKRWYALHTKPRAERRVDITLNQRGVETFFPTITLIGPHKKQTEVPFFPAYLFMHVDLETDSPSLWQWTSGLRHIVAYGDQPVPIPEEVIRMIGRKLDERVGGYPGSTANLQPGDIVRIKDGPFREMLAVFEGPSNPSTRVSILLRTLNRAIRVRIATDAVEKVSRSTDSPPVKRPRRTRGRGRRIG